MLHVSTSSALQAEESLNSMLAGAQRRSAYAGKLMLPRGGGSRVIYPLSI